MLRLEKLELRGFKSFCDATEIRFHEGITAVVGPNGCGKSNILDGIAWVLGEQSARSLRGGKMDDVIFNGTRDRKPVGLAEVTLTLVATDDISPVAEVDDIQVGGLPPEVIDPTAPPPEETAQAAEELLTMPGVQVEASSDTNSNSEAAVVAESEVGPEVVPAKRGKPDPRAAYKRALAARRSIPTIAAGERVTITRRLHRSGESEYLMNGHACRLRDIQEFFAGTGLGGAQYAIIEQGHIGQILSAKPQERRGLIEEAAGITKFKAKKHLAELKLEATRQNLSRLNDIIAEVDRQLSTLKRQAAKARRYRRLREQIREYWRYLFIAEHRRIKQALADIEAQLQEARAREQALAGRISEADAEYKAAQADILEKERELEEARSQATGLSIETDRTRSRIVFQREQQREAIARAADYRRELSATAERAGLVEKEIARRRQDLNRINQELSAGELQLGEHESAYRAQQEKLTVCERELDNSRNQLLAEVSKTERLRHLKQQLEDTHRRIALQLQSLGNEAARAQERLMTCEQEHARLSTDLDQRSQHMAALSHQLTALNQKLEAQTKAAEIEQVALDELSRECARTEDRLASLVELDEQRAYFSEPVQLLLGNDEARRDFHLLGTLADYVDVPPEHEMMVERVMGDKLQSVVVPSIDDAVAAADWLQAHQGGRATFLITGLHGGDDSVTADQSDTPTPREFEEGASQFFELLGLNSPYNRLVRQVMPDIAEARVASDLNSALKLSSTEPSLLVVTPVGEQVRACSMLVTGSTASSSASVLQLKREIKELTARTVSLGEQRERAAGLLNERRAAISQLEIERGDIDAELRDEEKRLAGLKVEMSQSQRELERARQHVRVNSSEREQAEAERAQCEQKFEPLNLELSRAEQTRADLEKRVEQIRAEIADLKPEVETAAQGLAELRADTAAKLERRRAAALDVKRLEDEQGQLARRSERDQFELLQLEGKAQELAESLANAENSLKELEESLTQAREDVELAEHRLVTARAESIRLENALNQLREEITAVRELRSQADIDRTRLDADVQYLEQACRNELAESLDTIVASVEQAQSVTDDAGEEIVIPDVETAQKAVNDLRAKIEELGPVNMMALEELEETEKRYEFLQQQYKDVTDSIVATEEALREIKRRSRARFREAFEQINANFSAMFQELFGGGRGEMVLIDEDDVLESGIDIIAQPPGKRLQSILLLSGGEKAMTALSLVLGIFKYRPSPFCVLDEVDAPLDDINIGRFTEKIIHMSEQTQFLIITHSKRTMESASSLYGVTMEEAGVSKLISVRFDN